MTSEVTFEQILEAMQRNADTAARLLIAADLLKQAQESGRHGVPGSTGGNLQVNFGAGGIALWASVTCAIVTTIVSLILVVLFAAAFVYFANQDNWAAQEVTSIRSYITNGKLKPMAPRPGFSESIQQPPHPEKSP